MPPSPELVKQVKQEMEEIKNAPPIAYGPTVPTCHFCGRVLTGEQKHVETLTQDCRNGQVHQRLMGGCCGV